MFSSRAREVSADRACVHFSNAVKAGSSTSFVHFRALSRTYISVTRFVLMRHVQLPKTVQSLSYINAHPRLRLRPEMRWDFFSRERTMKAKTFFIGVIAIALTTSGVNACDELNSTDTSQAQSSNQVDYKEVPTVTGMSLQQAVKTLKATKFEDIAASSTDYFGENKTPIDLASENYHVTSQDPSGQSREYTNTTVNLTVHENKSRTISNIVAAGEQLDSAMDKLRSADYRACDYTLNGVYGAYAEYYILEIKDGDDNTLPSITTESYAAKKTRDRSNTPDEELAHGGAFCSEEGATAFSDRSTSVLTCSAASDGRLRWIQ